MKYPLMEIVNASIIEQKVDAIVNAANNSLLGGGGVDGVIHRAAGPGLLEECVTLGGCETGGAKITSGHHLPAKFIIHTVGPVWRDGTAGEADLLEQCYHNCLMLAVENKITSIAFPAISTGAYSYPKYAAAAIAINTVKSFLIDENQDLKVIFCCMGKHDENLYHRVFKAIND